jgi:hypothetical protein
LYSDLRAKTRGGDNHVVAHVRLTLENKAFAAYLCNEKSFARALSCDMLRAESHAAEHFFLREFFS